VPRPASAGPPPSPCTAPAGRPTPPHARPEALADLAAQGLPVLTLDVADDASVAAAVEAVIAEHGGIDLLVNNAGQGPLGPVEDFDIARWQALFDTNVFGVVRMMQAVLPHMRRQGSGRIVNVGSMGGEFTTVFAGAYHATKYSLEAVSDAARVEVLPFGVQVVLLQPGPVRTPLAEQAADVTARDGSPYARPWRTRRASRARPSAAAAVSRSPTGWQQ
jgi:NAD(P)-dependent dehydrogenase (short-subunit alcohol dehydrogenase family)